MQIAKCKNHPRDLIIRKKQTNSFLFSKVQFNGICKKVKNLDITKSSQKTDVPSKILTQKSFHRNINNCLSYFLFLFSLQLAEVTPVYKSNSKICKDNFRSVSILSTI